MSDAGERPTALKRLAEALSRCPAVTKFDTDQDKEAWTLAHSLVDLEGSFREVIETLIPKLMRALDEPTEVEDVLHEIGEEFRHILYHLRDPRFFRYLHEDQR